MEESTSDSEVELRFCRIAARGAVRARAAEEGTEEYTNDALLVAAAAARAARFSANLGMDEVVDFGSVSEQEADSPDLHVEGWPLVAALDGGASGDDTTAATPVGAHIAAADVAENLGAEAGLVTMGGTGSLPRIAEEDVDVRLGRALSFAGTGSDLQRGLC
jgi:hypothetical protein